ncbi:MAG TPA: hypothetical protein VH855_10810, partial [Acetobacteraceae bacterium]
MQRRRALEAVAVGAVAVAGPAKAQTPSGAEPTFDRVRRAGVLRIAALPGEFRSFARTLPPANGRARRSTWRRASPPR